MLQPLTPKEAETLDVVVRFLKHKKYPPTLREVAETMGVSRTLAVLRFNALAFKGYMHREKGESRAIRILFTSRGAKYKH